MFRQNKEQIGCMAMAMSYGLVLGFLFASLFVILNSQVILQNEIIIGENITLTCLIPNYNNSIYPAKWKTEMIQSGDLTTCWSARYKPSKCIPNISSDRKYHFESVTDGIKVTILNFNRNDSGIWICVKPDGRHLQNAINYKNSLQPPTRCILRMESGLYTCFTSCIGPTDKVHIRWNLKTDTLGSLRRTTVNADNAVSFITPCAIDDDNIGYEVTFTEYAGLSGRGNLSCTCGLKNHHQYDITSNTLPFYFKGSNGINDTGEHHGSFIIVISLAILLYQKQH